MHKLNQSDFIKEISEKIEDKMLEKYDFKVSVIEQEKPTLKTNMEKTALCIRQEGSNISPTIYTDDLYSAYCDGKDVTELVEQVSRSISQSIKEAPEVPEITLENAKKNIILTLINVERNQKLLENTPHMLVGGEQSAIAAIPRWKVGPNASFVVNRGIAESLKLTDDEVLSIGQKNIDAQEFSIRSMAEVMRSMMAPDMDDEFLDMLMPEEPGMIILSNFDGVNGANAILSEATLDRVLEDKFEGSSFFILPSSLHEVICVSGDMNEEELKQMVSEVNSSTVEPADYLSNGILHYDGCKLTYIAEDMKLEDVKQNMSLERSVHYAAMHM